MDKEKEEENVLVTQDGEPLTTQDGEKIGLQDEDKKKPDDNS